MMPDISNSARSSKVSFVERSEDAKEEAQARPRRPAASSNAVSDVPVVPSVNAQQIADHMLGDQPAKSKIEDRLGFGMYVAAVAKFLTDSSTKIPITLSIEGIWGSGKSSFMLQLQEALRNSGRTKVVAFNAWQYNADDGLWAAFIHEFDEALNRELSWSERIWVRLKLFKLRARWQGWVDTLTAVSWLAASLIAFIAIAQYLSHSGVTAIQKHLQDSGKVEEVAARTIGVLGGVGGVAATLLLFLNQVKTLFKSPASLDKAARLFARTNFDGRLPLIHQLTRDFNSLVTAYAGEDDVYVFIDDLDRCEYAKAAELMQALLMLLSTAPKIALIIGLDRDKVAAAMATKQDKLIPYLYKIQPGEAYKFGMEYGQRFIEKFIQVSFVLPMPRRSGLKAMINPEAKVPRESMPESQKSAAAINIVTGKDDSEILDRMIEMADEVFGHNPRNIKQFVNMFRLQAFIANETGLFGTWRTGAGGPLTIPQLGKFVVLCMRWQAFVDDAIREPFLIESLESLVLRGDSGAEEWLIDLVEYWRADKKLLGLLEFGQIADDDSKEDYSMAHVDLRLISEIAPPRPQSAEELVQQAASDEDEGEFEEAPARPRQVAKSRTPAPRRVATKK